jgi:hypothetical protein
LNLDRHLTRSAVIGAAVIAAAFARELLGFVADVLRMLAGLEESPIVSRLLGFLALPVPRLLLVLIGVGLIVRGSRESAKRRKDDLAEQRSRGGLEHSVVSVFDAGLEALAAIPEHMIGDRTKVRLWRLVLSGYQQGTRDLGDAQVRPDVFRQRAAELYKRILEMASLARFIYGDVRQSVDVSVWLRRVDDLERDLRARIGDGLVDNAKSLADTDMRRLEDHAVRGGSFSDAVRQ